MWDRDRSYPLFPNICNVAVGLEKGANIESLSAPQVAMDGPVERELQGPSVEGPVEAQNTPKLEVEDTRRVYMGMGEAYKAACRLDMMRC